MPISEEEVQIALSGRLTFAENADFRQVVAKLDQVGSGRVVIDLGELDFMDSTGMGMLLVAREQVAAQGGRISLRRARGQVGRMLALANFADFFIIEP